MAVIPKAFIRGALPASSAPSTATVPANKRWVVTNISIANVSTTAETDATVTLDGISLIAAATTMPSGVMTWDGKQVLEAGKIISAFGSVAGNLHCHISGVEMDV